uniref:Uracil-DNA glycosylase n=1 Tax=Pyramimonas orientalis virus TaxID=455367 RepID=A0A7L9AYM9_POV01|nr:uracil-DNA glycosylase [Pyramimonas orientalis virus]
MKDSWKTLFGHLNTKINSLPIDFDSNTTCPSKENIMRCFNYFDANQTKVVICGQDPYHTKGTASGLAFESINTSPPSLRNIFKEVRRSYPDASCIIDKWAEQGVLMLNRSLTVELDKPNSHSKLWKPITNEMLTLLNDFWKTNNIKVVFMLWGNNAKELEEFIDVTHHYVLKHTHPSPLSRKPFIGNGHFQKCNVFLEQNTLEKIDW